MTVHITNLYGFSYKSTAQIAQNQVAKIACDQLGFKELGIYHYDWSQESSTHLQARFDGIIASVAMGDTVIFQSPSWNTIDWDIKFIDHLSIYQINKVIFIHDVVPLMFPTNRYLLPKFIDYYNRADVIIAPTKAMVSFLQKHGLKVDKIVLQEVWDHVSNVELYPLKRENKKIINFAGDPEKFTFVNNWNYSDVSLHVFSDKKTWSDDKNAKPMGWQPDPILLSDLRNSGGFGLLWSDNSYWSQYMTMNVSYKLSTYLAAGIPVIINSQTPARDLIVRKRLGIIADSLDEAVIKVKKITDTEYANMIDNIDSVARLIREGYFTKKLLIDAILKLQYE
ncbi:sugar transferase [Limosilactobacillus walteri]|uniref:Glucosyltransferase 3 n=1 Tax=Limosilactobacillus walteri TaxID=2268022 RepID=A0ABR8P8Q7_9LACO|nr:sugar transferase [Limosilactobacillus walteri]MBD5807147.1 beta-1,6-galactofuranosyltransferase [Limosilactobacillus walteri]